jgi:hypothetical protein
MVSNPSWIFEQLPPGTGDVDTLNSEFFPSGGGRDVCRNLVRECTQNAIDEALTTLTETGAAYQTGVRVNHGTFGLGTVQSVKPDNDDFILTIRFDGEAEPRHLLQKDAENGSNLRPVTSDRKVFLKYQFGNRDGRALTPTPAKKYMDGLEAHFKASVDADINAKPAVRNELKSLIDNIDSLPYLLIEDFNTNGLIGDVTRVIEPSTSGENFYWFFRNEGKSGKKAFEAGSRGVGKQTLHEASEFKSFIAYSIRNTDKKAFVMGKTVLTSHNFDDTRYPPRGFYAKRRDDGLQLPIEDQAVIESYVTDFQSERTDQSGLSVAVLSPDASITSEEVMRSSVYSFFFPILRGELAVATNDNGEKTDLDRDSLVRIATETAEDPEGLQLLEIIELARFYDQISPTDISVVKKGDDEPYPNDSWTSPFDDDETANLRERFARGDSMVIRVPVRISQLSEQATKVYERANSYFDVILKKSDGNVQNRVCYIRDYLRIPNRGTRTVPAHVLLIANDGPLSRLLRNSEGPSHNSWNAQIGRKLTQNYRTAPALVRFVNTSVQGLVRYLSAGVEETDQDAFKEFFSTSSKERGPRQRKTSVPKPLPTPEPREATIQRVDGGFKVSHPQRKKLLCPIRIEFAYDSTGAALRDYNTLDFTIDGDLFIDTIDADRKESGHNFVVINPRTKGYEVTLTGFDPGRDLLVSVINHEEAETDE